MIRHLCKTPLAHLSVQYAELRLCLVSHQLRHFESHLASLVEPMGMPLFTLMDQQQEMADIDLSSDSMLNCIDPATILESETWYLANGSTCYDTY